MNNDDFTVLVSGSGRCHRVSMCTVWLSHSKWLSKYSNEPASNFVLSLNIPPSKLFGWFKRPHLWATGDWQFITTVRPLMHHSLCTVFWQNVKSLRQSAPYIAQIDALRLLVFPKLKSPVKGKRFQTIDEIQENTTVQLMAIRRTVWGPKAPTLKGTEASLSCVQCLFYLVPSSINISSFHIMWLDTFWTDLVCVEQKKA